MTDSTVISTQVETQREPETTPATPMSLLQDAIAHGMSPDVISKFMDLQDREASRRAREAYNRAMAACQAEMPPVFKDRINKFTNAKYTTLDAVNTTIKPIYTKHGISVAFNEVLSKDDKLVTITATISHSDGFSKEFTTSVPIDGDGMKGGTNKTATQAKGSTLTYARRYLILMAFNIAIADEDNDGNSGTAKISEESVAMLQHSIDTCTSVGLHIDMEQYLKAVKVPQGGSLKDITQANFVTAQRLINNKLRKEIPPRGDAAE